MKGILLQERQQLPPGSLGRGRCCRTSGLERIVISYVTMGDTRLEAWLLDKLIRTKCVSQLNRRLTTVWPSRRVSNTSTILTFYTNSTFISTPQI